MTKSLSTCLCAKDLIFFSLMKLSLAGYEILGGKFSSLSMLNIGPQSLLACRVSVKRSAESDVLPFVGDLMFLSGCP